MLTLQQPQKTTYARFTKDNEKGIKTYQYKKSSVYEGRHQKSQNTNNWMTVVSPYQSIITLNVNGLSSSIKKQREDRQVKNKNQQYAKYNRLTLALRVPMDSK